VVSTLIEFIEQAPDRINIVRNAHGETLLHTAVLHQRLDMVQILLQHGADPTIALPDNGDSHSTLESVAPRSANFKHSRMLHAAEATSIHYGTYASMRCRRLLTH
jgi:ankyrin repeat protein